MSRYLVVTEGAEPSTAEPLIATADPRLVAAALAAMFGEMSYPARSAAHLPPAANARHKAPVDAAEGSAASAGALIGAAK